VAMQPKNKAVSLYIPTYLLTYLLGLITVGWFPKYYI